MLVGVSLLVAAGGAAADRGPAVAAGSQTPGPSAAPVTVPPAPPPATVPPPAPPPASSDAKTAAARKRIDEGDLFLRKGDQVARKNKQAAAAEYARALAAYKAAFALVPSPKIYFGIATAEERLGLWRDAADHYRRVLAGVAASPDTTALRRAATHRLDAVMQRLGVLALTVTPAGATVTVDGRPVGTAPLAEPLLLAPGEYTVGFLAAGHAPREISIRIEAGSELERTIAMAPQPVIVGAPRSPPRRRRTAPASRAALWGSVGATAALAAAATTSGLLAVAEQRKFDGTSQSAIERGYARRRGRRMALFSDALIGASVVMGAFSAYYYVQVYRPRAQELERKREMQVVPYLDGDGAGVALSGSF